MTSERYAPPGLIYRVEYSKTAHAMPFSVTWRDRSQQEHEQRKEHVRRRSDDLVLLHEDVNRVIHLDTAASGFARIATLRGHVGTICEKTGQLSRPPFRISSRMTHDFSNGTRTKRPIFLVW